MKAGEFKPEDHLIQLPRRVKDKTTGKWANVYDDYLEVKWRLVWFRRDYPRGTIETQEMCIDLDREVTLEVSSGYGNERTTTTKKGTGYARFRAVVTDGQGGTATGTGTCAAVEFADFVEKAETVAVGRALAALGIGTQFVGAELEERDRPSDAPVRQHDTGESGEMTPVVPAVWPEPGAPAPAIKPPLGTAADEHPTMEQIKNLKETAKSTDIELRTWVKVIAQAMQLPNLTTASDRFLRTTMSMAQYEAVETHYRKALKESVEREDIADFPPPETPQATPEASALPAEPATEERAATGSGDGSNGTHGNITKDSLEYRALEAKMTSQPKMWAEFVQTFDRHVHGMGPIAFASSERNLLAKKQAAEARQTADAVEESS